MYDTCLQSVDNLIETEALVEQHIHGGFGIDFSLCKADDFIEFSKKILKYGVCAFFPTLATDTVENLQKQISEIKKAMQLQENSLEPLAKILGVHLEACFLNPVKKGIHDENLLLKPTIENFKLLEDDIIKIVTLAPELDEGNLLCAYLKEKGIRVSAGHCMGADLSHVDQVTHLYNAMGAFSHRTQSTVVSALCNDNIYTEIIADGIHVQKDVLNITFRTKPLNKIILISDALPITHSDKDSMDFCSKKVFLQNGKAVDSNGTIAGSTAFVYDIIKMLVNQGMLDLRTACAMASKNLTYIQDLNSQLYWDSSCNIQAMNINGALVTF